MLPRKKDKDRKSEKASVWTDHPESPIQRTSPMLEEVEYRPGRLRGEGYIIEHAQDKKPSVYEHERDSSSYEELQRRCLREGRTADEKKHSHLTNIEGSDRVYKIEVHKSGKKVDGKSQAGAYGSDSDENEKHRSKYMERRKHKRVDRHELNSDDHHGSQIDERKEAKERRKEERRLQKEERHRRHEERHHRREERKAAKMKVKSVDMVTPPSDFERNQPDANGSDEKVDARRESHLNDAEDSEFEQKRLEIELRKKALESLRAKKGINN